MKGKRRSLKTKIKWLMIAGSMVTLLSVNAVSASMLFQDDNFATIDSGGIIINNTDKAGDIVIQFGQTLAKTFKWSIGNSRFELGGNLDLGSNQLSTARVENVSALPGGAGGLGVEGTGRIVQLTAIDSVAPGCTGPFCSSGTYSWNGGIWKSLQGSTTVANATKIVTVGPTGRDYTTVAAAAAYLNTLSAGEMWIDPGVFPVTTVVDVSNIKMRGADLEDLTTIDVSGGGKLMVISSKFEMLTFDIDAGMTSPMAFDVVYDPATKSAVEFSQVSFKINGSKIGMDSTAATPPNLVATFNMCTEVGTGVLFDTIAASNLDLVTSLTVINVLSTDPLKISNWPVKIIGGSNVVTSGNIISVPDRTILVSPGMNIQGAINSLGANGGVIKLLVGIHDVTNEVTINNNNIKLTGEGPGTILRAQTAGWTGGATIDNCLIQVGLANGTTPRHNIIISDFKNQIGPNIHGICINGGSEIKVMDMVVESIDVKSDHRVGIIFTDGATTPASRLTATRSIVTSDVAANRWVDGVHFDGNASLPGQLLGYGNGISDSIISEMIVNEARETSYAFAQVSASGIFSNRARNIAFVATAFGLFLSDCQDVAVINNTIEGANAAATAISMYSNVDNSTFIGNVVRGGPSDYAIGLNVAGATSARNLIVNNQFESVTTKINNAGTDTKLETTHVRSNANPTVNDDIVKNYGVGTIWINTSTQGVFVSVSSTAAAAVWKDLTAGGGNPTGTTSNSFTLDTDNTGGNVTLQFGAANNKTIIWNSTNNAFITNAPLEVGNSLTINGGTPILNHLSVTAANLASSNMGGASCGSYGTITVTGAAVGDTVIVTPTPITGGIETVNLSWSATVTAANTVTIRACNPTTGNINTANTQTWRADVWKH